MNFIQWIFGRAPPAPPAPPRERPPDWDLTLEDLVAEMKAGKRTSVGSPEADWARDYERSLLPDGTRFPRKGDLYESNRDQTVYFLTAWSAPFTGGGDARLLQGERIWVHTDPGGERPLGTYALPVEYETLEQRMVPPEERKNPRYGGFYFYFKTVDLNRNFTLIGTGYDGKGTPSAAPPQTDPPLGGSM